MAWLDKREKALEARLNADFASRSELDHAARALPGGNGLLMRRLPVLFAIALLVIAAGITGAVTWLRAPIWNWHSPERQSTASREPTEADTSTAVPPRHAEQRASRSETEGRAKPPPAQTPPHANPGNSAADQAALQPPPQAPAPPDKASSPALASTPPAEESAQHSSFPQVAVPLPRGRPTPEEIREQNTVASSLFSELKLPSAGAPRPIGFYSAGCLAGGEPLALQAPHWQVMRPSRNRYWGYPELIKFIERLADDVAKHTGWPGILVGDMAQPRGGPLPSGHASHQIGLDVDIWLHPMPAKPYTRAEADSVPMVSLVEADNKTLDPKLWQPADAALIKLAAKQRDVERLFVNPAIKQELCRTKTASDEDWMPKVRPWYGHDDHMHVRLKCPTDTPGCREQAPIPEGDGCDKSLDAWFSKGKLAIQERLKTQAPSKRHVLMRELPFACTALLHEPSKSRLATSGR
jgi:penicillin-insensitive murein DD-endopeptidase